MSAFDGLDALVAAEQADHGDVRIAIMDEIRRVRSGGALGFIAAIPDSAASGANVTTAIATALTAAATAGGGVVFVRPGVWVTSETLKLPNNVTLMGAGPGISTIKAANGFAPTVTTGFGFNLVQSLSGTASNISICDLTLDHNSWTGANNFAAFTGTATAANSHTVDIRSCTNFLIDNVQIVGSRSYGLYLQSCMRGAIRRCRILTGQMPYVAATWYEQDCIQLHHCDNVEIASNDLDSGSGTNAGGDGVKVLHAVDGQLVVNISIHHNRIQAGNRGVCLSCENGRIFGVSIDGNEFRRTEQSCILLNTTFTTSTVSNTIVRNVLIANNQFNNACMTAGDVIWLQHPTTVSDVANHRNGYDLVSITNNIVRSIGWTGAYYVRAEQGANLRITGNEFVGCKSDRGIALVDSASPVIGGQITNNRIVMTAAASGFTAVFLGECSHIDVLNNSIWGHATGTTYGIQLTGDVTPSTENNAIVGNKIKSLVRGVYEIGAGVNRNVVDGNRFYSVTTPVTLVGALSVEGNSRVIP